MSAPLSSPSSRRLRIVAPQDPAPLPEAGSLLSAYPCRPGDRHELVELRADVAEAVALAAAPLGICLDVAASVLVEATWLRRRLNHLGCAECVPALDHGAQTSGRMHRRLTAAEADYVRSLVMGSGRAATIQPRNRVALPTRLLGRLDQDALAEAAGELNRAVSWEAAALIARESLSEWGLAEPPTRTAHRTRYRLIVNP